MGNISIIMIDGVGYLGNYNSETNELTEASDMPSQDIESNLRHRAVETIKNSLKTVSVIGQSSITVQTLPESEQRIWERVQAQMDEAEIVALPNLIAKEFGSG